MIKVSFADLWCRSIFDNQTGLFKLANKIFRVFLRPISVKLCSGDKELPLDGRRKCYQGVTPARILAFLGGSWGKSFKYCLVNMSKWAITGLVSGRCWQHRSDISPVMAHYGMFTVPALVWYQPNHGPLYHVYCNNICLTPAQLWSITACLLYQHWLDTSSIMTCYRNCQSLIYINMVVVLR